MSTKESMINRINEKVCEIRGLLEYITSVGSLIDKESLNFEKLSEELGLFDDSLIESLYRVRESNPEEVIKKIYNTLYGRFYEELLPYFSVLLECMKLIIEKDEYLAIELKKKLYELPDDQRYLVELTLRAYKYIDIDKDSINEPLYVLRIKDNALSINAILTLKKYLKNKMLVRNELGIDPIEVTIGNILSDIERLKNIVQEKIAKTERVLRKNKNPENVVLWKLNREIGRVFKHSVYEYFDNLVVRSIIRIFIGCLSEEIKYYNKRIFSNALDGNWDTVKKYEQRIDYLRNVIERFNNYETFLAFSNNKKLRKTVINTFLRTWRKIIENSVVTDDTIFELYGYYLFIMLQKDPKFKEKIKREITKFLDNSKIIGKETTKIPIEY